MVYRSIEGVATILWWCRISTYSMAGEWIWTDEHYEHMAKIGLDPSPCNIIANRNGHQWARGQWIQSSLSLTDCICRAYGRFRSHIKSYSEETWHPFLPAFGASSYNLQHSEHAPIGSPLIFFRVKVSSCTKNHPQLFWRHVRLPAICFSRFAQRGKILGPSQFRAYALKSW